MPQILVTSGKNLRFVAKIVTLSVGSGMALYCVELGQRQTKNYCRMMSSVIVAAKTPENAVRYVEQHLPNVLAHAVVQRVFKATHVVVNWPNGTVEVAEKGSSDVLFNF